MNEESSDSSLWSASCDSSVFPAPKKTDDLSCVADSTEARYLCTPKGCGQLLKTRFSLNRHRKIHTGLKPYTCPVPGCGKSFPESNTLKRHNRVHTGEKPFRCRYPDCQKAFTDASNWRRHERTHIGEKPYKCPIQNCEKAFSRGVSLKKHMTKLHSFKAGSPIVLQAVWKSNHRLAKIIPS